jgi:RNA recognition motif-containing protein
MKDRKKHENLLIFRTVFCMQLAARIRPRDLEEFFSSVGKVRGYYYIVSML